MENEDFKLKLPKQFLRKILEAGESEGVLQKCNVKPLLDNWGILKHSNHSGEEIVSETKLLRAFFDDLKNSGFVKWDERGGKSDVHVGLNLESSKFLIQVTPKGIDQLTAMRQVDVDNGLKMENNKYAKNTFWISFAAIVLSLIAIFKELFGILF